MLLFVKSADGILRAVALESGSFVSEGMVDGHDVSADAVQMHKLLSELSREKIISAWKQIALSFPGVNHPPPSNEIDKSTLITRFLIFFDRLQFGRTGRAGPQSASPTRLAGPVAPPAPDFSTDDQDDLDIELRFFDSRGQLDIDAMLTMRKGEQQAMTAKLQKSQSDALCECVFSPGVKVSAGSWNESLHHMTLEELEVLRSSMTKEAAQKPVSVVGGCLPALQRLRALRAKVEATLLFVEDMLCEDFVFTFQGSLIKLRDAVSEKIGQLKAADFIATVPSTPGTSSSPFRRFKSSE